MSTETKESKTTASELGVMEHVPVEKIKRAKNRIIDAKTSDMQEMITSVREQGIITPILVARKNGHFQLIAGERRLTASIEAGKKTIPAYIRDMSGKEARMAQLSENLNRKDLTPLEEADMYALLQEDGWVPADIVKKVGKTLSYVSKRIKLKTLQPGFRKMLELGMIDLGRAIGLARLPVDTQRAIAKQGEIEKAIKKPKEYNDWHLKDALNKATHKLSEAPFNTQKEYVFPGALKNPCTVCPFNTKNDAVLFPTEDVGKDTFCTNPGCFNAKTAASKSEKILKALNTNAMLGYNDLDDDAEKEVVAIAKQAQLDPKDLAQHRVLNLRNYEEVSRPRKPTEQKGETKKAYEGRVKQYEEQVQKLEISTADGKVIKSLIMDGYQEGQTAYYKPKGRIKKEGKELNAAEQKAGILERDSRKDEIEAGKMAEEVYAMLMEKNKKVFLTDKGLTVIEQIGLILSIENKLGWQYNNNRTSMATVKDWLKKPDPKSLQLVINKLARELMVEELKPHNEMNADKNTHTKVLFELSNTYCHTEHIAIMNAYDLMRAKRKDRVEVRVKALKLPAAKAVAKEKENLQSNKNVSKEIKKLTGKKK